MRAFWVRFLGAQNSAFFIRATLIPTPPPHFLTGGLLTLLLPFYCTWNLFFNASDSGRLGGWFNAYGICCGVVR